MSDVCKEWYEEQLGMPVEVQENTHGLRLTVVKRNDDVKSTYYVNWHQPNNLTKVECSLIAAKVREELRHAGFFPKLTEINVRKAVHFD